MFLMTLAVCISIQHNVPINTPILALKRGEETDLTTKNIFSRCNYLMCTTKENISRLYRREDQPSELRKALKGGRVPVMLISLVGSTMGPRRLLLLLILSSPHWCLTEAMRAGMRWGAVPEWEASDGEVFCPAGMEVITDNIVSSCGL